VATSAGIVSHVSCVAVVDLCVRLPCMIYAAHACTAQYELMCLFEAKLVETAENKDL
jgi:hypothetical protein